MTSTTGRRSPLSAPRRIRIPVFWSAWALLFVLMSLWSVATPLMASPDEPAHVIRAAAVVRGEFVGNPSTRVPGTTDVTVPKYIADTNQLPLCFAHLPAATAGCAPWPSHDTTTTASTTTATLNSPVFYAIVGTPSLVLNGAPAMYGMRILTALLTSGLLAIAFAALARFPHRRFAMMGMALGVTPMVLFLGGTVNPNPVEAAGAAATLATMMLIFRTPSPGRTLWLRLTMLVVSVFFLVNTRSISLGWLLAITAAAILMADWKTFFAVFRRPASWVAVGLIGVIVALVGVYFLIPKGLTQIAALGLGSSPTNAFQVMLDQTFGFGAGWIGWFGWLDAPPPGATVVIWTLLLGALVVGAVVLARGRLRLGLIAWLVVFILVPPITQAALVRDWGFVWQGRYALALFVGIGIIAGIALDDRFPDTVIPNFRRLLITGLALLGFAQVLAFAWALKRYIVGLDLTHSWIQMLTHPQWHPPVPWLVLTAAYALVTLIAAWALYRAVTERPATTAAVTEVHEQEPALSAAR